MLLLSVPLLFCVGCITAAQLPSPIEKCSFSDPNLNQCLTKQAKVFGPIMVKGIPEMGIEAMDPLTLNDVNSNTGSFVLKCKHLSVKGIKNLEIKNLGFDWKKKTGTMHLYGNVTFLSDYETEGKLLLLPFSGNGKLTVRIRGLDLQLKYKLRLYKDDKGVEHLMASDEHATPSYEHVKMRLTNILGNGEGGLVDDAVNQVLNDNWRELMVDLGPPFVKAIVDKVELLVNKFYAQVPFSEMTLP